MNRRVRLTAGLGCTVAAEEFETEDAAYDERDATDASDGERLAEEHDTEYGGPDSANPSPDSVGSSNWELPQRYSKQPEAEASCDERDCCEVVLREAM
jgi:hypothetical protein